MARGAPRLGIRHAGQVSCRRSHSQPKREAASPSPFMPLISATRLRIRSPWYLPAFFLQAFRSANQAKGAPGNLAVAVLNDTQRTFWTCSSWVDQEAMRTYMSSGVHQKVMRKLAHWCDEASVVHWEQDSPDLPNWLDIHRRMQQDGRSSRVAHASPAHLAFRVPPPDLPKSRPVRLK